MQRRDRWTRVRIFLLGFLVCAMGAAILHRAHALQVGRGSELKEMAEEQYMRRIKLAPRRGTVFDRNGTELSVSVSVQSVWANPKTLKRRGQVPEEVARRLAQVLDIHVPLIAERLSKDRYFVWIKRRVSPRVSSAIKALKIPGVHLSKESKRFYPNGNLAAHVLGFTDVDGKGLEGIELSLDGQLRGLRSAVPAIRDRRGRVVFSEGLLDVRATQGADVHLSIDKSMQHVVERELGHAVHTFEARAGSVVVVEPRTGEVLALANYPTYNPNDPGRYTVGSRRNRAVTDRFEPGSTVKPFTFAGALANGSLRAGQSIDCQQGEMEVADKVIHDTRRWGVLSPAEVLAYSSNIGTAKVGGRLGRRGLFRTMRRFGLGSRTGVELPGETAGILRHYRRWYEMDAATVSFGQGLSVTNIQMAMAMAAIANGGKLMRPLLVRRMTDPGGRPLLERGPRVRRRVVREDVARTVSDMMTSVTGPTGTGYEADIPGYLVAGKTGTAQKADYVHGGYAPDKWLASFAGFVPAQDPRVVVSIVLDEPRLNHYGGTVAAPVFRRIASALLLQMGLVPGGGVSLTRLAKRLRDEGAQADASVSDPPLAARTSTGGRRRFRVGEVPDVSGLGARAALSALGRAKLRGEVHGSGVVVGQAPAAGEVARAGAVVRLALTTPPWVLATAERGDTRSRTAPPGGPREDTR